jgi:hypothetical protein
MAAPGHAIGGVSINVDSTSLWPTDTGVIFAIDTTTLVSGVETRVANSYTVWEGIVTSATSIGSMVLISGTDQNYSAGATTRVYILPTSARENRMVNGLLVEHKQTGAHSDITADNATITNATITTPTFTNAPDVPDTVDPIVRAVDVMFDFVASGCVWTADAAGSTRLASMTAGVVYINGARVPVSAVVSRTFTASKDVYVDVGADGTIDYTDGTTNDASPALSSSHIRLGIIVVGASSIAAAASVNQGQEDRVLPIASSITYTVTDSLGNLICPRDPNRKVLGFRKLISNFVSTATGDTQITGMSVPFIAPGNRKIEAITGFYGIQVASGAPHLGSVSLWDGAVGGTKLAQSQLYIPLNTSDCPIVPVSAMATPAAGLKTYNVGLSIAAGVSKTISVGTGLQNYVEIRLA